jgi:large repetitive protein
MSIRLLFAFLLFLSSLSAQNSAFETLHRGYVTLGLNGGLSYQSSDVRARFDGYGLGLTLAKNLYYHPASPITFDLRGRFLLARQYGLDGRRSFNIADHPALNGTFGLDYLNYPSELGVNEGFVYHNHRTTVGELAGEAVLSWHSDRLGPGVFVSLFGGLGLGVYNARIDQADRLGAPYYDAYANLEGSARRIRRELKNNVLDGNYETLPDPFNRGGAGFMPSAGLEAGIQLTPHFAIAAGHRVTFSGTDILDGNQWAGGGNDLYHYTSLGLKFTFPQRAKRERGRAPNITITYPSGSTFNSNTSAGLVRARIANVQSPADILCTVNGQTFPFDFYAGELTLSFP